MKPLISLFLKVFINKFMAYFLLLFFVCNIGVSFSSETRKEENLSFLGVNFSSLNSVFDQINKWMFQKSESDINIQEPESDIHYPPSYSPMDSDRNWRASESFKEAMVILDSNCLETCDDYDVINAIRYSLQEEYLQLHNKIKTRDESCQKKIIDKLARKLKKEGFPKKCLQEENKNHPVCRSMSKDIKIVRDRVLEIVDLTYGSNILKTTEAQALCLDCGVNNNDNFLNLFSDLVNSLVGNIRNQQCLDLKLNKKKRVYPGTKKYNSYIIKREPDGTYSILLDLKFVADEDYDGKVDSDKVPTYYMNKVKKCLNQANKKMLGPNGKRLKILIQKEVKQTDSICKDYDTKIIKIGSKKHRSISKKYEADIDCPTITHEVLHLLGLVDEYNDKDKYDCRVVTTNSSIMSRHYRRWSEVFDKHRQKRIQKESSLLTPGQFNAILYGSCEKKNKAFNECSQLAYINSSENPNCLKKKQECERQNSMNSDK